MNKPILKIHIGTPKTGTTYIQSLLKKCRKTLLKHDILYPLSGLHGSGHAALAVSYLSEETKAFMRKSNIYASEKSSLQIRDNILYEHGMMKSKKSSVIISAEGLAITDSAGVQRIAKDYLPYFNIQVIIFLRRQDFMAESSHAQAYRVNQKNYNAKKAFDPSNINLNYTYALDYWSSQFGEQSISVVEYPEAQGAAALKLLTAELFGLPSSLDIDSEPVNERLSRDVLEYIFEHTKLVYGTKPYFKAIERLILYSSQNPSAPEYRNFYSPEQRQEIISIFAESNALVASTFKKDLFSSCPPVNSSEEWEEYPGLSKKQIVTLDQLLDKPAILSGNLPR